MPRLYVRDFRPKKLFLFGRRFDGFRGDGFHLDRLGGNAGDDVVRRNVFGRDAHRADHAVLADGDAAHHGGVVGDARARADLGLGVVDDHAVVQIVVVRVDVGVVGDRRALVDDDFAAIVEQNVFVYGAVVLDGEVVAE